MSLSPVEAANIIREALKSDLDLSRSTQVMVKRTGCKDIYEWCNEHPDMASALAEQLADIDGQVRNMSSRLESGDLS